MRSSFVFVSGALAMALCAFAAEPTAAVAGSGGGEVLVEINGTKITLSDFERKRPGALFQARNSFFEAERKAVEDYVYEFLVEEQAKKEGVTVAQLMERHVNSKLPADPPEDALKLYYEGVDTNEPYEAVRGQIIETLRQRRLTKIRNAYLQSLRSQATIAIRMSPPRAVIAINDISTRGPANAPLKLVEYADYECPYCQQIKPVIDRLQAEFQGKLVYAYKDYPLNMHPNAPKAAEASRCAEAQGKYWEFHDGLYERKQLSVPALKVLARDLKLDEQAFNKCLDSGEKAEMVRAHMKEANGLGLQGTPSFFVNGRFFSGSPTYEALRAVVEEELARSGSAGTPTAKR